MALDIQALQWIYGANTTYATGNDSYALPNAKGGFTCIWDCGGTDSIIVTGRRGAVIDLRAATGTAAEGGGGFVSHVAGSRGGYTIAVGVVIENATGGNSNDTINGNAAGNVITGNGGRDIMTGGAGSDCFVFNSLGNTSTLQSAADVISDFTAGSDRIDVHTIDANVTLKGVQDFSFLGEVAQFTAPGQVRVSYTPDQTLVLFNTDRDQQAEALIVLTGHVSLTDSDFLF
jgi:Ca2+-binding RTX toxin-like protein